MEVKKYGVSLSSLKTLREFQLLLKQKKRKKLAMPFQIECSVSINDSVFSHRTVCADSGNLSIEGFCVYFLKNNVNSFCESDTEVTIESKGDFSLKIVIKFGNSEEKTMFITSLGNLFETSDESSDNSSPDSGI